MLLRLCIVTIIAVCSLPQAGYSKDTIKWMTFDWKPAMSLDAATGKITGGLSGNQLLLISKEITDYNHVYIPMNWGRFWDLVRKKNENICNCVTVKTEEREGFAEFSEPVAIALPLSVIMRKDSAAEIGNPKSVSIVELMKDSRVTGGLIQERSYTEAIDSLLSIHEKKSNISRYVVNTENSVLMLLFNRMDYILEYPSLLETKLAGRTRAEVDKLVVIPIIETDPYYFVYVACTKNEWGKKAIIRINKALEKLHKDPRFVLTYKEAFSGERLKRVEKLYNNYFK